jgi:Thioredoxin domain
MNKPYLSCCEGEPKKEIVQRTKIEVLVISSDNCRECDKLVQNIMSLQKDIAGIELTVFNIDRGEDIHSMSIPIKVYITPALFVNGRLKYYGNPSQDKMKKFLSN